MAGSMWANRQRGTATGRSAVSSRIEAHFAFVELRVDRDEQAVFIGGGSFHDHRGRRARVDVVDEVGAGKRAHHARALSDRLHVDADNCCTSLEVTRAVEEIGEPLSRQLVKGRNRRISHV